MQFVLFPLMVGLLLILFPYRKIDKRLEPSVDWVMNIVNEECPKHNYFWPSKIEIKIEDKPNYSYIGICRKNPLTFIIEVQQYFYEMEQEEFIKQLMAHELIHCIFNQDHINEDGNLMNPNFQMVLNGTVEEQLREFARKSCQK